LATGVNAASLKRTATLQAKRMVRIQKEKEAVARKALQSSHVIKESRHERV